MLFVSVYCRSMTIEKFNKRDEKTIFIKSYVIWKWRIFTDKMKFFVCFSYFQVFSSPIKGRFLLCKHSLWICTFLIASWFWLLCSCEFSFRIKRIFMFQIARSGMKQPLNWFLFQGFMKTTKDKIKIWDKPFEISPLTLIAIMTRLNNHANINSTSTYHKIPINQDSSRYHYFICWKFNITDCRELERKSEFWRGARSIPFFRIKNFWRGFSW